MRDYLHPFESDIRLMASKEHDLIDQAALLWRLIYHVVLRYRAKHPDWLFVRHKDISEHPFDRYRDIFDHCSLPYTAGVQEAIAATTSGKRLWCEDSR